MNTIYLASGDDFGPATITNTGSKILYCQKNRTVSAKKRSALQTAQELFAKICEHDISDSRWLFNYSDRVSALEAILRPFFN